MRFHRGFLFWGLSLVTAGLVALAIQLGYLDRTAMAASWRLWPLLLVALGTTLILLRTQIALLGTALAAVVLGAAVGTAVAVAPGFAADCGDSPPATLQDHTGTLGASASLHWRLDCGSLDLTMGQGSSWRASVGSTGNEAPTVDGASDHLDLDSANQGGGFFLDRNREHWVVQLPAATTYHAEVHINTSKAIMHLTGARFSALSLHPNAADVLVALDGAGIEGFDVELNAGSLAIIASGSTALSGTIQTNAGSVKLCAPSGTGLRITASGTAFGTNLEDSGLARNGDTWESASYAQADHRVALTVHGNAASFDLNPAGGCR